MGAFLLRLLVSGFSLLIVDWLLESVYLEGFGTALFAALILGLVNATLRPALIFFTLPISFVTFGFFLLIINALTYWFTSAIVPGFDVDGFGGAFLGALITSIVTWFLNSIIVTRN